MTGKYAVECREAALAARKAGAKILEIRETGFDVADKGEAGPVTTADLAANGILKEALLGAFPEDGWLSEETVDDPARLERSRVWIIDPLDGTREYVKGIPEYCVSVALVEEGEPVVGVIYNPSADELFTAVKGGGARCNDEPLRAERGGRGKPLLAASRSEIGRGQWAPFEDRAEILPAGSAAYKLCLVAAGRVDGSFTLAERNEWDIAAGVLIVAEAGGRVCDRAGEAFRFNEAVTRKNGVFASTTVAFDEVFALCRIANDPTVRV